MSYSPAATTRCIRDGHDNLATDQLEAREADRSRTGCLRSLKGGALPMSYSLVGINRCILRLDDNPPQAALPACEVGSLLCHSMLRRLFTFVSAVSLLLCVATCALWVRSYRKYDAANDFSADVIRYGVASEWAGFYLQWSINAVPVSSSHWVISSWNTVSSFEVRAQIPRRRWQEIQSYTLQQSGDPSATQSVVISY